jgi:hypothetical protein
LPHQLISDVLLGEAAVALSGLRDQASHSLVLPLRAPRPFALVAAEAAAAAAASPAAGATAPPASKPALGSLRVTLALSYCKVACGRSAAGRRVACGCAAPARPPGVA